MKYDFIKVNNTVYDYKRYIKEVEWLKWDVKRKILDILDKKFVIVEDFEEKYDHLYLSLYNEKFDFKLEIVCNKKNQETFV